MCKNQGIFRTKAGAEFYMRESSKPIFSKLGVLTVQNIYNNRVALDTFKVMKNRTPLCPFT